MKRILSMILIYLCLSTAQAQINRASNGGDIFLFFGAGQSFFSTNDYRALSKFTSTEIRTGLGISKPFNHFLSLTSQVGINLKRKTSSLYDTISYPAYHLKIIDATMSFRHHVYVEVPVLLSTEIPRTKEKLSFAIGIGTRYWLPNKDNLAHMGPDFLSNQVEAGLLAALSLKLKGHLKAQITYFHGITNVYKGFDEDNNQMMVGARPFEIRNRGYSVVLSYSL